MTQPNLEHVSCASCGTDDTEALHTTDGLIYVRCRSCGLVYVNPRPRPDDVQSVYEKAKPAAWFKRWTYGFRKMSSFKNLEDRLQRGEVILHEVERYRSGGRILDVGCNRGFILAPAAARGWEAHGIEVVPWVTQMVEREFGVKIYNQRLREIDPPLRGKYFDAITMIDILEHLHEPLVDLREIHRILKDDGILLINTVDLGSAYARITGYEWSMEKPREHLYLFDRNTLSVLVEQAGFRIVHIGPSKGGPGEFEVHVQKQMTGESQ
jgi:2-polyprenyl-3-methyl-5-hydroxy-6-metoxy-1,4-benzoquinol methylase